MSVIDDPDEDQPILPSESEVSNLRSTCTCGKYLVDEDDIVECSNGMLCSQRWFHRDCAGIMEPDYDVPSQSTSPTIQPNFADTWICDFCLQNSSNYYESMDLCLQPPESDVSVQPVQSGSEVPVQSTGAKPLKSKSKNTRPKRTSNLKREEVVCEAGAMVTEVLERLPLGPEFQSKFGHCQDVLRIAEELLKHSSTDVFQQTSKNIITELWTVLTAGDHLSAGPSSTSVVWSKFHEVRINRDMKALWDNMFQSLSLEAPFTVRRLLEQHILETILLKLLIRRNEADAQIVPDDKVKVSFNEHDENVIRYVGGFIPFSLKKRYKRCSSSSSQEYVNFLETHRVKGDDKTEATSFLSYTTTWISIQNRGGLFQISDDMYKLFRRMEVSTREILRNDKLMTMKDVNMKTRLTDHILEDDIVRKLWCDMICKETQQVNWQTLIESMVNYWVKIRLHAFVRVLMDERKRVQAKRKKDHASKKDAEGKCSVSNTEEVNANKKGQKETLPKKAKKAGVAKKVKRSSVSKKGERSLRKELTRATDEKKV